ncbi:transposase [Streptomyces sp. NPDC005799]|uniref:transposase n=1 Tax=Streptomyces sp. NPDC005799 TaxID=3154678 RepID=UPI0033C52069
MLGECKPSRNGANFAAFLKKAVKLHAGKEIHVVLDNLSTHTTPNVKAWLAANLHVHFHFTPVGPSWLNQIEIVHVLGKQIRDYIDAWNENANPFTWTPHRRRDPCKGPARPEQCEELVNNNSK